MKRSAWEMFWTVIFVMSVFFAVVFKAQGVNPAEDARTAAETGAPIEAVHDMSVATSAAMDLVGDFLIFLAMPCGLFALVLELSFRRARRRYRVFSDLEMQRLSRSEVSPRAPTR